MTKADSGAFEVACKRLAGALQWRGRPAEFEAIVQEYFAALEPYALEDVLTGAQVCRDTLKRFPKIAEWRATLKTQDPAKPTEARWMSVAEMDDHDRAAACRYEDDPCGCAACREAGVDDRPLRFVQNEPDEQAWHGRRHQLETVGHWAHGEELARWYAAKDALYALRDRTPRAARLVRAVRRAFGEREPGEDG